MGIINKAINFFRESYLELQKSIWLSKQQMIQSTLFVFIVVGLVALYIAIIDLILTKGLSAIIGG
jgi:preprotein translocase SecE subunit